MERSLYLKGLTLSDGRDGHDFVNTPTISVNNASLIFNKAALFALNLALFAPEIPLLGSIYSHLGNKTFPAWE